MTYWFFNFIIIYADVYTGLWSWLSLTIEERISELASKGIISNVQNKNLIEIFSFIQTINSKTSKISFQELDKIDELIEKLRDINIFFKSIFDKKKIERRREKVNRIKGYTKDQF